MGFQQGLSGLNASSRSLDVIGHNIANANTSGFKFGRAEFGDVMASSIGASGAGTVGIGVEVSKVAQIFTQGNINITNNDLDIAINGSGFFTLRLQDGSAAYTRAGEFKLDTQGYVITNTGAQLMGYPTNTDGVRTSVTLQPIQMPVGLGIPANVTSQITAAFNLDARAPVWNSVTPNTPLSAYGTSIKGYDSQGSEVPVQIYFRKITTDMWQVYTDADNGNAGANMSQLAVLKFDTAGNLAATYGATPSASGPIINGVMNVSSLAAYDDGGGFSTADIDLDGDGVYDILLGDALDGSAGFGPFAGGTLSSGATVTPSGTAPYAVTITGVNLLNLSNASVVAGVPDYAETGTAIQTALTAAGIGDTTYTVDPSTGQVTFTVGTTAWAGQTITIGSATYTFAAANSPSKIIDMSGNAAALTNTPTTGTSVTAGLPNIIYSTTVTNVDTNGDGTAETALTSGVNPQLTMSSPNPLIGNWTVDLDLSAATQFGQSFRVGTLYQDGYESGELVGLQIAENGIITARFSNGETQAYGQVALANFRNVQGLSPTGNGEWVETDVSGQPIFGGPTEGNLGSLRAGALEESNVDLTKELVNMMTAQRSYQANAQTIKTQDQVMQTLVNMR
jgi:flagellar hook protein FlgE